MAREPGHLPADGPLPSPLRSPGRDEPPEPNGTSRLLPIKICSAVLHAVVVAVGLWAAVAGFHAVGG